MNTQEKIKVMEAFVKEEKIEYKTKDEKEWNNYDSSLEPAWDWINFDYRIKPKTFEIKGWLNYYENGSAHFWELKEEADTAAGQNRIACIPINYSCKI